MMVKIGLGFDSRHLSLIFTVEIQFTVLFHVWICLIFFLNPSS